MFTTKIKSVSAVLLVAALVGGTGLIYTTAAAQGDEKTPAAKPMEPAVKQGKEKDDFTPKSKAKADHSSDRPDSEAIQGEWRVLYSECKGQDITKVMWEGQSLVFGQDVIQGQRIFKPC